MSAALALALLLAPQGAAAVSGRVLDIAGAPVADAAVTLLSRPIPRAFEGCPEDRRVARSDAKGRFRAEVAPGQRYTVWSASAAAASAVLDGVTAGEFVELREVPGSGPHPLTLSGADAWHDAATFSMRAIVGGENIDFVTLPRTGAGWTMPPMPPMPHRQIEVLDGRGEVLWSGTAGDADAADGAALVMVLPPPREFAVEVRGTGDEPIAGADVRWHIRNYWYTQSELLPQGERYRSLWPIAGTTGADGRVTVRVPWPDNETDLWLITQGRGHRMSLDGFDQNERFAAGRRLTGAAAANEGPIRVTLTPAEPQRLPLTPEGTTPACTDWIHLVCRVHVRRDGGGKGTPFTLLVPIADGAATLPMPLPDGTECEIADYVRSDAMLAAITDQHGFAPPRVARATDPTALLGDGRPDAARFGLAPGPLRAVRVTAADGRPAARAIVHVRTDDSETFARADRLGRALVPSDLQSYLTAIDARGIAAARVVPGEQPIDLQLRDLVAVPVLVVERPDTPVAGVRLTLQLHVDAALAADGLLAGAQRLLPLRPVPPTGADGRTTLLLPDAPCSLMLHANWPVVDRAPIPWDPKQREPIVVTVRAPH